MTFEKVAGILAEYKDIDISSISMESTFNDLGLDSLDTVELVMQLEDAFGVSIEMSEGLKSIADLVNLIDSK